MNFPGPRVLLGGLLLLAASPSPLSAQPAPAPVSEAFRLPPTDEGLPGEGPIRRYDWFQRLWQERRAAWATQVQQDQQAVVFVGDSITQGWGDHLGDHFEGLKVANRGISGDTSRGVLIRLDDDVLALHPRAVVLLIGTNDLEENATPETIAGNLRRILARLKAHDPAMPVLVCQVFPSSASKRRPAEAIRKVNALYAEAVQGDPQVTLIDTWRLFANPAGDAPEDQFPDLLHPNSKGYATWAAALRPHLATLGFLENAPDTFPGEPGFEPLFNGRDLTGWGYRPSSPEDIEASRRWKASDPQAPPWPIVTQPVAFDGKTSSDDRRYQALHGRLVVTSPPEGRKIQQLWTQKDFPQDFVLVLEFRASPNADSGVFIRGRQLQCRDYRLAGPYTHLQRYRPQQWNELVVTVRNQVAQATCNGEILEANFTVPASGPIGLEGDRGQMEYRRLRIRELPPAAPSPSSRP